MANKKINQLVSKTSILSTDLFGIGDATTGQLFKKTIAELQAAIGGAVISVNGLVGTVVLDTDDIQELATPTNKYFTDARARGAISLTVTGNSGASTYSSGTGVLNVPTYTLAGLGGITASFLSGTSGISYNSSTGVISYSGTVYTDASIRALLSGGTGITYNSSTGAISYSGTVYTDSSIRGLISLTTTGSSGASTYNNTTGVINVPEYTLAGLGGISLTSLSGGTGITYNSSTGAISYSGTVYTDASVRALVSAGTGISYNNTTGVITYSGTVYTDASIRGLISLTTTGTSGASTYNSTTGVFNIPQYATAFSGTTNYHAKFTSSSTIGNSLIFDNGTNIGIGTASPDAQFNILGNSTSAFSSGLKINRSDQTGQFLTLNYEGGIVNFVAVDSAFSSPQFGFYTSTNGTSRTERIRITSAGNVGIGTTTPVFALEVSSNSNNAISIINYATTAFPSFTGKRARGTQASPTNVANGDNLTTLFCQGYSGTDFISGAEIDFFVDGTFTSGQRMPTAISFYTNIANTSVTERMRITSAGNVGIGTTSPSNKLEVIGASGVDNFILSGGGSGATLGGFKFGNGSAVYGSLYFSNVTNDVTLFQQYVSGNLILGTNNTEKMRITSGGNMLMGTTSDNGERLYVSGSIRATGSITANSDISLKKNLLKIENALEKVEQINGYTYELKEDDSKRHAGVIAQEIQTVLPEIVNTGNDGLMGVEYGNISALLIEAIKEQQTQIKELKALLNK